MNTPRPQNGMSSRPHLRREPLPVLILDDERVDRYRMARLCSGLTFPCEVQNASTLAEFEMLLEEASFGLILVDFMLTDGTGLDALEMVRVSARNLNAPTVMVTGLDQAGIDAQARAAGCTGFLSKDDLTQDHFAAAVQDVLIVPDLPARKDRQSYSEDEVEHLLSLCAAKTVQEIKPMVSRLLRQMRDNRTGGRLPTDNGLAKLEENCMSLWLGLIEMERESGENRLKALTSPAIARASKAARLKAGKPPSPFTRLQH